MNIGFYPKLSLTGIFKNKKIYIPYILACSGIIMMYYIISFLSSNESVSDMRGGEQMQVVLGMGCGVIAVFAVIFMFYINSFIMRRRKKEFGLYNILGMGKRNIAVIMLWESILTALSSLFIGTVCGILFSKLGELVMTKILNADAVLDFKIDARSIFSTIAVFGIIFLLIFLNDLRQVRLTNPIALLKSESMGEKPPKANWVLAVMGIVLLAGAYYIACTINDPLSVLALFFVAVIMVIAATYMLFISGSVTFCRILQNNKRYYYKTSHFVSVSSMVYRMKRNGAGLASICILSTMVLVMISSTFCLYIGAEDSLKSSCPRDVVVDTLSADSAYTDKIHNIVSKKLDKNKTEPENVIYYQYLGISGYFDGSKIILDQSGVSEAQLYDFSNLRNIYIFPVGYYNQMMNSNEKLKENEVIIFAQKESYELDSITLDGCGTWNIKKQIYDLKDIGLNTEQMFSSIYMFVKDMDTVNKIYDMQEKIYGDHMSYIHDYYAFDLKGIGAQRQTDIKDEISKAVQLMQSNDKKFPTVYISSIEAQRTSFYALYGGLLFLGVLLGIVFVLGAVLIMYYKQITEGYEDQSRFGILQNVGMSVKEIKRSINSQVLTVFFLPLIAAGIHVCFAFPLIQKLLILFGILNVPLLVAVTACCYFVFAVFYVIVYKITSKSYFSIVSASQENI